MRLAVALVLGLGSLFAQTCPPGRILPAEQVSGALGDTSCRLPDSSPYAAYRLDLPVRGIIGIALTSGDGIGLILRDAAGSKLDSGTVIRRPIEAGSYIILVNGRAGAFVIETSFIAE